MGAAIKNIKLLKKQQSWNKVIPECTKAAAVLMLEINYDTRRHPLLLKNLLFSNIMQSHSRCHSTGLCILHLNQIQRVLNRLESLCILH